MDRRITSRLNMANAVKQVCDNKADVVALIPAFVLLVATLKANIKALNDLMKGLTTNNSGIAEDKTIWKTKLSLLLSVVCGAGVPYSRKIADLVLEKNFNFAESTLFQLRDTELIQTAYSIIELQATVAAQLEDYGITKTLMNEVKDALEKFEEKNPKPIVNIHTSEADRNELLEKAFELSDFVLQDMMKAALIYKVLNPNFYLSLDNASRISKVGIRHEEPVTGATQDVAEQKEAQQPPNSQEMLKDAMDTMNTNPDNAATETSEAPAVHELSLNGV